MTVEILLYILGAALVPALWWAVVSHFVQREILNRIKELQADTEGIATCIEENVRVLRSLTHYVKYLERQRTGVEPPPPLEGI
jgi:hypothetical protein